MLSGFDPDAKRHSEQAAGFYRSTTGAATDLLKSGVSSLGWLRRHEFFRCSAGPFHHPFTSLLVLNWPHTNRWHWVRRRVTSLDIYSVLSLEIEASTVARGWFSAG